MDNREKIELTTLVFNDKLKESDAIICLEGDGQRRTEKARELFEEKWAPVIVVSGGYDNPPFSIIASKMADYLIAKGVQREKIIFELNSRNTREQAEEVMKIAKEKNWKKIILVASQFHQPRAYLTFLKAMNDLNLKIVIINAPVNDGEGMISEDLLESEFFKIKEYGEKGHVFTLNQALEYQTWKKSQN